MEEQYHFTFPTVAHVQQQGDQLGIWNLPLAELPLRTTQTESFALTLKQMEVVKLGTFSNCHNTDKMCTFIKPSVPKPITCFRKLLHLLKLESPDFPIYRDFRRLHLGCIQDFNKPAENVSGKAVKEKGGRSRKSKVTRSKVKIEEERKENCDLNSHVMWTEKYKPTTADDIVGNGHSIGKLKNWLENWKHYSDVQHGDKGNDCKRKDSSSGDEFMDCDSNDTSHRNLPNNTAILVGPHGCGKTSAVYAIANELGFKVLEINTSSKRNGRRILSELQEATQSHQVRAGSEHASDGLNPFFKGYPAKSRKMKSRAAGNASKPKESGDDHNSGGKMSVILVEGVRGYSRCAFWKVFG
ncbi:ATPase family AAA domain-containing protein 5 [Zootermopsis nevadensis]|uniref:ATPase family AAA domain-containing protein 5 n=1 Tax=Zootermopsis nevadensis TaxID=136037 RepID=A0A067R9X0_ZOONE|nr:ATPase family AAA domain-containing protein 5 [Zootermopsis nevadensis]